jgi:chitodextrinase
VGSQTWFTAPGATSGASSITVNTEAPSLNFPTGSVIGLFAPAWDIISYQWSFGDGGAAVGATTQHTFTEAGSFTVTLTMIDIYGGRSVVNGTLAIT